MQFKIKAPLYIDSGRIHMLEGLLTVVASGERLEEGRLEGDGFFAVYYLIFFLFYF
jgi:hypothetical protein